MVLRGLTQLLHTRAQGRSVVLFVDNAHDLDELSTMMVAQLCAGGHVLLLAACVDLPNLGSDIMGLWKDDLLRRVDLGPFDFSETADSLAQEYGGHFSHTAARALWNASGGNALFLHSLAREQIKLGIIVRHEDSWVLGDRPVALAGEIRDVLKARLNRLSPGQRDVFELLSLAGALPLQTLMNVSKAQDIDTLQERALIRVSHDHPPMVSIANPVTAGIVASVVPPGRSAELRRRLGAVLQDLDLDEYTGSTAVAWALDCGEEVDPAAGPGGGPPREQGIRSAVGPEVYPGNRRDGRSCRTWPSNLPGPSSPCTTTRRPAGSWPTLNSGPATDCHWTNGPPCSSCGPSWTGAARPRPANALARLQEIELRLTVVRGRRARAGFGGGARAPGLRRARGLRRPVRRCPADVPGCGRDGPGQRSQDPGREPAAARRRQSPATSWALWRWAGRSFLPPASWTCPTRRSATSGDGSCCFCCCRQSSGRPQTSLRAPRRPGTRRPGWAACSRSGRASSTSTAVTSPGRCSGSSPASGS